MPSHASEPTYGGCKAAHYDVMRTRRADLTLATVILVWLAATAAIYLATCQLHGYDDTMCRAYHACSWRDA